MTIARLNCMEQFEQAKTDHEVAESRTPVVKYQIYDLHPCKSHFVPPAAFKFDPVKFSGKLASKGKHCLMRGRFILIAIQNHEL